MNGDRLTQLEEGFLEGKLTTEEEAELKDLVAQTQDHHLKTYFQWTAEGQELEVPNMEERMRFSEIPVPYWKRNLIKMAATLLILLTTVFIFRAELFTTKTQETYTQEEIDKSYEATLETLTAMASFLNNGLTNTEQGIDFSAPFKDLNSLNNTTTQEE